MSSTVVIVVLVCAFVCLLIGVILYCLRQRLRSGCSKLCRRKKRVHQITVPVKATGENEIVLAVTQRRENVPPGSLGRNNPAGPTNQSNQRPSYRLTRHESFLHQSDVPSPLVSNMSSLQSLLMSSQVAICNSSPERLSLSSQNQLIFHPISLHQQLLNQQFRESIGGVPSPYSVSPAISNSSVHLPQPSYFDDAPPSYQESMVVRQLRASERSRRLPRQHIARSNSNHNSPFSPPANGIYNQYRRSCRM